MDNSTRPIAASMTLSILLHSVAFVASVLLFQQAAVLNKGVGSGVEIELISSMLVSQQKEASLPRQQHSVSNVVAEVVSELEKKPETNNDAGAARILTSRVLTSLSNVKTRPLSEQPAVIQNGVIKQNQPPAELHMTGQKESVALMKQATSASQQQHSIIELLHSRISDNKKYPYLARRQRREGTTTIAFVLHPDGRLENAHLVSSSQTIALDRAALAAVKDIEPFADAQKYIEQAKEFQIDVVFDLL